MKKTFTILLLSTTIIIGQSDSLTLERKKLIILPSDSSPESIETKITNMISAEATNLGRFDVIDRSHLEAILEEQKLHLSGIIDDKQVVKIGEIAAAEEALLIQLLAYNQKGVPPKEKEKKEKKEDEDDSLLEWIVKEAVTATIDKKLEGVERYPHNIQTVIHAEVRLLNIKNGKSIQSFKLYGHHTGGTKAASLTKALRSLHWQVRTKLKKLYILSSEVVEIDGNSITILSGENLGLAENALFEIASKDRKKTYKGKTITIPGKPRGIVRIKNVGPDASTAHIVRKWRPISQGNKAYEIISHPRVNDIHLSVSENPSFQIAYRHWVNPFSRFSFNVSGQIGIMTDSDDNTDGHFGFGFGARYHLFQLGSIGSAFQFQLPINLVSRSDDDDHLVTAAVISPMIGWETNILINKSKDFFFSVYMIPGNTMGPWTYSESSNSDDDESVKIDAVWHGDTPTIDLSGLFLSAGIRFIHIR